MRTGQLVDESAISRSRRVSLSGTGLPSAVLTMRAVNQDRSSASHTNRTSDRSSRRGSRRGGPVTNCCS